MARLGVAMNDVNRTDAIADLAADLRRYLEWAREVSPEIARDPKAAASPPLPPTSSPRGREAASRLPPAPFPHGESAPRPDARAERPGLASVQAELGECTRCKLHRGRRHIVFGTGNERAELVFVGEGPGTEEDVKGLPFVGAAGQLLDKMIEAMGFKRSEVYICNVVKCIPPFRPPNNRYPEDDEIAACSPFLRAQIDAIQPKVIVTLGRCATQTLLNTRAAVSSLRGQWQTYKGIKLMPTFHPAYLLRSPHEKRKAWEDLKKVMEELPRPRKT